MDRLAIGIVGGTSPESTAHYYLHIVRRHFREFQDHSYPRILIASVNFQALIDLQEQGRWEAVAEALSVELSALAAAGADFGLLAANTMHKCLPWLKSPIPLLSIYDAVAEAARQAGVRRLGLTGTRYTMSEAFYRDALVERGLEVICPEPAAQTEIHRIIFDELVQGQGKVSERSIEAFRGHCAELAASGAEAVLLACTELEMLTGNGGFPLPLLDTAAIHAEAAWRRATAAD